MSLNKVCFSEVCRTNSTQLHRISNPAPTPFRSGCLIDHKHIDHRWQTVNCSRLWEQTVSSLSAKMLHKCLWTRIFKT
jgi:hypothetical protein